MSVPYPVPGPVGGILIRRLVKFFRDHHFVDDLGSGRLCVLVSGGNDSVALAVLLSKYGRRIVDPSRMTWVHFDHGWRPESSTIERDFVKKLAESFGCEFQSFVLTPPSKGMNKESFSRNERLKWLKSYVGDEKSFFQAALTAHHADDVVETLLWRFLRGQWNPKYRFGVRAKKDRLYRPLLTSSKRELAFFLKEEGIEILPDPTNEDPQFHRAWLRMKLLPIIESRYPQFRKTLLKMMRVQP